MSKPDFSAFTKPSALDWKKQAIEELKGKSFDETLTWLISEEVTTDAFHQAYVMSAGELKAIQDAQRKVAGWEYVMKSQKQVGSQAEEIWVTSNSQQPTTINQLAEILKKCEQVFREKTTDNQSELTIVIAVPIDTNYFLQITSLRAIRYLTNRLSVIYDKKVAVKIWAYTQETDYKTDNPHINIVRATTMAMSAIIGGCDYLEITPFDEKDAGFGQRIARNTSILLQEEAFFDKVADLAAGSYFIENLTFSLIEKVWKRFLSENEKIIF